MSEVVMPLPAEPRHPSVIGRVLRLVLVVGVIALLVAFARTVDWHAACTSIRNADRRWIAAAIVVNLLSIVVKGFRWWVFLRRVGECRLWLALRATLAAVPIRKKRGSCAEAAVVQTDAAKSKLAQTRPRQ